MPVESRPRLAVAADLTFTFGPDDPYWFNYTNYRQNALRLFIGTFGGAFTVVPWLEAVGELRVENVDNVLVSALYARVQPWRGRPLTISVGRVPPVFGAFALTRYGSDNPLISRPLAYQYLTTLRYDVVPVSADSLLAVRGSGWRVLYPESRPPHPSVPAEPEPGVEVVSTSRWDTGVVANVQTSRLEVSAGITTGSLSEPRVSDNNGGKQLVGRVRWHPAAAWTFGVSAADGAFLSDGAVRQAGASSGRWPQRALGVDVAFARGYFGLTAEVIYAWWRVPQVSVPRLDTPLGGATSTVQATYRLMPRLDVATRGDWLGFSQIAGTIDGGRPTPWDANVARVEAGVNYRLARRARLKAAYQYDWRFGATREEAGYPGVQLALWF